MELSSTSPYIIVALTSTHLVGYWNFVLKSSNSKLYELAAFIGRGVFAVFPVMC